MRFHYEPKFTRVHCNKKFHTSSNLSLHLKFHFEPTYTCAKCGTKFHSSEDLKRHGKRKRDVRCNLFHLDFNNFIFKINIKKNYLFSS